MNIHALLKGLMVLAGALSLQLAQAQNYPSAKTIA